MMKRLAVWPLLLLLICEAGCKTLDRRASALFGAAAKQCYENEGAREFLPLQNYLKALTAIVRKSNPQYLGKKEFCFEIERDEAVAIRYTNFGVISFSLGLLRAIETDAQFAALLSHVFAHTVFQHDGMQLPEFVDRHKAFQDEYLGLTLERQEILRYDILHIVPEGQWTAYLDELRELARERWLSSHYKQNALAKNGLACSTIGTWRKVSNLRKSVMARLPFTDYEQNLCEQFFQEFNVEEKFARLLANGKEIEADRLGIVLFLNAAFPEDEYTQFFANVSHLGGGQKHCQDRETRGDCFRTQDIRREMKEFVRMLSHPRNVQVYLLPVDIGELKRMYRL